MHRILENNEMELQIIFQASDIPCLQSVFSETTIPHPVPAPIGGLD